MTILGLGVWGTYFIKAYHGWIVTPPSTVIDSRYVGYRMGNIFWFEGAKTRSEHFLRNIAWYNTEFINAVPTVFWIFLFFYLLIRLKKNVLEETKLNGMLDLALLVNLAFPTLFALQSSWLYNRYYNIFIYFLGIYVILNTFTEIIPKYEFVKQVKTLAIFVAVLFVEVILFSPTYGYFRPLWSYADTYERNNVVLGKEYIPFIGWNLEHASTQEKIYKICSKENNCSQVRIFNDYGGAWTGNTFNKPVWELFNSVSNSYGIPSVEQALGYKNTDYFVLSRVSLYNPFGNRNTPLLPKEAIPSFVIKERGYTVAWVYRGNELNRLGFSF